MKSILIVLLLVISSNVFAQQAFYRVEQRIYLSLVDSMLMVYEYPVFAGVDSAGRLNRQIEQNLLPDPAVLEKLKPLNEVPANHRHSLQIIRVTVTYQNKLIVCLQTSIKTTSPGMPGAVGDLYFQTLSIAGGNEYYMKNLFTKDLTEAFYKKYQVQLDASGAEWDHLNEHLVNFGLISDNSCNGCLTVAFIVNTLYSDAGPMLLEMNTNEIRQFINPDGPLFNTIQNN